MRMAVPGVSSVLAAVAAYIASLVGFGLTVALEIVHRLFLHSGAPLPLGCRYAVIEGCNVLTWFARARARSRLALSVPCVWTITFALQIGQLVDLW